MKKILAFVLAATMMFGCMTACSGGESTSSSESSSSASESSGSSATSDEGGEPAGDVNEVEGTLTFWHGATDDIRQQMYDNAIARFNEQYPNVKVEQTKLDSDAYKTKIKTVMGAGATDIPDVFMSWGGDALKTYVDYGLVADITDEFAGYKDEYYDFAFGLSTYDDKIYGVGIGIAPSAVFYNKDIFEKVGVEVPTTYEELDQVCAKLKEAGYIPFALGNKNKWPGLLEYTMLGVDLGGKEMADGLVNRTVSFDNEVFVEAGYRLLDFVDKGYYPDGANGIDHNAGGTRMMFYNEIAAMFIMTNGFISNCQAEDPDFYDKVGAFQYPVCDEATTGGVVAGGNVFSVSSQMEDTQMGADFLYYLTNAELSQEYLDAGGSFTGAKDVTISDPLVQAQFDALMNAKWTQNFYDQQFVAEVGEAFKDATQAIYGKTMTPEEAAAYIEEVAVQAYGPLKS